MNKRNYQQNGSLWMVTAPIFFPQFHSFVFAINKKYAQNCILLPENVAICVQTHNNLQNLFLFCYFEMWQCYPIIRCIELSFSILSPYCTAKS